MCNPAAAAPATASPVGAAAAKKSVGKAASGWFYRDNGVWMPYSPATDAALSSAFLSGAPVVHFTLGSTPYTVTFGDMTQTNNVTGYRRNIKHVGSITASTSSPAASGGSGAAASGDGLEEVITLRSSDARSSAPSSIDELGVITKWTYIEKER